MNSSSEWVPVPVANQAVMAVSIKVLRRLRIARIRRRGRSGNRFYEIVARPTAEWKHSVRYAGMVITPEPALPHAPKRVVAFALGSNRKAGA